MSFWRKRDEELQKEIDNLKENKNVYNDCR